jgi:hypothetical protein
MKIDGRSSCFNLETRRDKRMIEMRKGEPSSYSVRLHWKMPVAFSERVALSDSVIVDMKCLAYFCVEYRPYRRRHCDFVQVPCVFYDHGASLIARLPCKCCILTCDFWR